jgi:hypothetical protein
LPRRTVENGGGGLVGATLHPAEQDAQIVHHRFKDAGFQPALGLLIDGFPGREISRQVAPGGAGAHDPAQGVKDLAQIMRALRGVGAHQGQIGSDEGPFLVAHITRVRLAGVKFIFHSPSVQSS